MSPARTFFFFSARGVEAHTTPMNTLNPKPQPEFPPKSIKVSLICMGYIGIMETATIYRGYIGVL